MAGPARVQTGQATLWSSWVNTGYQWITSQSHTHDVQYNQYSALRGGIKGTNTYTTTYTIQSHHGGQLSSTGPTHNNDGPPNAMSDIGVALLILSVGYLALMVLSLLAAFRWRKGTASHHLLPALVVAIFLASVARCVMNIEVALHGSGPLWYVYGIEVLPVILFTAAFVLLCAYAQSVAGQAHALVLNEDSALLGPIDNPAVSSSSMGTADGQYGTMGGGGERDASRQPLPVSPCFWVYLVLLVGVSIASLVLGLIIIPGMTDDQRWDWSTASMAATSFVPLLPTFANWRRIFGYPAPQPRTSGHIASLRLSPRRRSLRHLMMYWTCAQVVRVIVMATDALLDWDVHARVVLWVWSVFFGTCELGVGCLAVRYVYRGHALTRKKERSLLAYSSGLSEGRMCQVCYDNQIEILFGPCLHLCVCAACADSVGDQCPVCRSSIHSKTRVHVP